MIYYDNVAGYWCVRINGLVFVGFSSELDAWRFLYATA